jgi:hypothetical protein
MPAAVVFNETGKFLIVKQRDDGYWSLPCGWSEPGGKDQVTAHLAAMAIDDSFMELRNYSLINFPQIPTLICL